MPGSRVLRHEHPLVVALKGLRQLLAMHLRVGHGILGKGDAGDLA